MGVFSDMTCKYLQRKPIEEDIMYKYVVRQLMSSNNICLVYMHTCVYTTRTHKKKYHSRTYSVTLNRSSD